MTSDGYGCEVCGDAGDERICSRCRNAVDRALVDIVTLHDLLDPRRPPTPPGERVQGTGDPPVPINIDAVDLAGPARPAGLTDIGRQWPQDHDGNLSVATVLDQWVRDWRETRDRGERLPVPTVPVLAGWLRARWDTWAAWEHPAAAEFADEMRALMRTLRRVTGVDRDQTLPIGPCPDCGLMLRATPWQTSVECRRCGMRWDREQWDRLAEAIREAA